MDMQVLKQAMHHLRTVALAEITWQEDEDDDYLMTKSFVPDYKTMEKVIPLARLVDLCEVGN